jgi:enamine deaminase RidA (YjgF/YER057c/UK114 family)
MTPVRCIAVPELADPVSHYSHATAANGFLFISGLLAVDADMQLVGTDATTQTNHIFATMRQILATQHATLDHVTKLTFFLTNVADRQAVNIARQNAFGTHRPASTLVEISRLIIPGTLVEIEAIAILP